MIVCGHGDVKNYCDTHGMVIVETHDGVLEDYVGICRVIVTDQEMSENEYLFMKKKLLSSGLELVSIWYEDGKDVSRHIVYTIQQDAEERRKFSGRCLFGYHRVKGEIVPNDRMMKVVRRIFELRDKGYSYGRIRIDDGVHGADGRKLSISTIALIVKNRERYEL